MKYQIEQYPKNKVLDQTMMSDEMKFIRKNKKVYVYDKTHKCRRCGNELDINEFYVKDKETGRRSNTCRDCELKAAGVVELGRLRFAKTIFKKNFRRCSVCKDIKPCTEFSKDKNRYGGVANNCKDCNTKAVRELQTRGKTELTDWYVREYGKFNYGLTEFDEDTIGKLRQEIIEKRKPKYFVDGKEFVTIAEFARYIEQTYNLPITMTEKRIAEGKTEDECKLSEREMRSLKSGTTKGKVRVTDTITGKIFEFRNSRDQQLLKMFSASTLDRIIDTGNKTRITKISKYPNPCIIERF